MIDTALDMSEVIRPELVDLHVQAASKREMIAALTDLLARHGYVGDPDAFMRDVEEREALGVTGIGYGVAIPHGKSTGVNRTAIAIGRAEQPIAWESLDDQPVSLVILFAVRSQDAGDLHLKLLAGVARLLARDSFIESLHQVRTSVGLVALFTHSGQSREER